MSARISILQVNEVVGGTTPRMRKGGQVAHP
jgi:hypothetical protein